MSKNAASIALGDKTVAGKVAEAILNFVGFVPNTGERKSRDPERDARRIANSAAAKAAVTAGSLALPPGVLGWLTILPELVAVWKIQAQMVADIAGIYGQKASLSREQMIYCLFRHTAAQAVRDLVVRVGERFLVRQVSLVHFRLSPGKSAFASRNSRSAKASRGGCRSSGPLALAGMRTTTPPRSARRRSSCSSGRSRLKRALSAPYKPARASRRTQQAPRASRRCPPSSGGRA